MTNLISDLRKDVNTAVQNNISKMEPSTSQEDFATQLTTSVQNIEINTEGMADTALRENLQAAIIWLGDITKRHDELKMTKVQYDTELKTAQKECEELFGTCDIKKLRAMFAEHQASNQTAVSNFIKELVEVEALIQSAEHVKNKAESGK